MVKDKKCFKCGIIKPIEKWSICLSRRDGLQTACKDCRKITYIKNKEHNLLKKKEYYQKNINKMQEEGRKKYEKNKDRVLANRKKYVQNNKEKINKYYKNKYKNNLNFKIKCRIYSRLGKFIKLKSKTKTITGYIGLSHEMYIKYLESKWDVGMSWDNYGHGKDKWCIDHIIPLKFFDLNNHEHLKIAVYYKNTQPMWFSNNCSKGSKLNIESADFLNWAKKYINFCE